MFNPRKLRVVANAMNMLLGGRVPQPSFLRRRVLTFAACFYHIIFAGLLQSAYLRLRF
jgi:hypothetical protein